MKEAQRFPEDFDGIIAGAPGLDWTGRASQAVRASKVPEANAAARLLQPQRQLLHRAVVDACDALDGVKDGVIDNPTRCRFDPGVLECKAAGEASCLTKAHVETARLLYSPGTNTKTKRIIEGLYPGGELGWTARDGALQRRGRPRRSDTALCPYPQVAAYKGSGSTDDAANFACCLPDLR